MCVSLNIEDEELQQMRSESMSP